MRTALTLSVFLYIFSLLSPVCWGCSTLLAGREATEDGSTLLSHTNDGDGDVAGNIRVVPASSSPPHPRGVSRGSIPNKNYTFQVRKVGKHTLPSCFPNHCSLRSPYPLPALSAPLLQYFTEGYAIINELQVALGESTCSALYSGTASQQLNIVDLGQLCLERAKTARECISVMGDLSFTYGYYDAGEVRIGIETTT